MTKKLMTILTAMALLAVGCGEEIERGEAVPFDKLPAGAMDVAKKSLPDVKFDLARKAKYKGQNAIEIRGKDKAGKIREVEVDATTGKLLEIE